MCSVSPGRSFRSNVVAKKVYGLAKKAAKRLAKKLGKAGKRDRLALGAATKQVRNMAARDQLAAGDALKESRRV